MTRETYLERIARQHREVELRSRDQAKWLLQRFFLGSLLFYGVPALMLLLKSLHSGMSFGNTLWIFLSGAALTAPTFVVWLLGGVTAFIPKEPRPYDRMHTAHGFSVRPPDALLQALLAASVLLLCLIGFFLMLGPVLFE